MDKRGGSTFHADRRGLAKLLGTLEAELMEFVWTAGKAVTAREVWKGSGTSAKYVTVVTVLNNLEKKGLLHRERRGKRLVFEPVDTQEGFVTEMTRKVLQGLLDLSPRIAVTAFVGALNDLQPEGLEQLREELSAYMKDRDREENREEG